MECNYLGVNITISENLAKEIKTQTKKSARVAGCLNDPVWEKETRLKVFKANYVYSR